ncbi:RHS repeat-associated core domain-containing protein [Flavobacteriaceae bacterium M23B6Z8]
MNGTENNHFTYNGKELEQELGLDWTDYGARRYMRDLGRWTTIDPASREYVGISPYSYAANNPNVFIDPDGRRLFFVGGANNDQDGWEYITRWGNFMTDAGIRNFVRVNASNGKMGDIFFTNAFRNSGTTYRVNNYPRNPLDDRLISPSDIEEIPRQHSAIDRAVEQIQGNLADSPLEEGEQFNLAGYSYGSVLQAQVALRLANDGQYIDNLILIGSPISDKSKLFKQLEDNENIGNVIRVDIEGDLLSNPQDVWEFIKGGKQNSSDDGPHFDLARPGEEANSLIQTVIQWLQQQGVE